MHRPPSTRWPPSSAAPTGGVRNPASELGKSAAGAAAPALVFPGFPGSHCKFSAVFEALTALDLRVTVARQALSCSPHGRHRPLKGDAMPSMTSAAVLVAVAALGMAGPPAATAGAAPPA